ncbi:MAG: hypothetical protein K8R53_16435 [Bacteroidales bacterium]|nr:hypothetical protein [Bacteroidales bacterium]
MRRLKLLFLTIAVLMLCTAMAQNPVLHWRFANPSVYDNGTDCIFEFDVELSCDLGGTYHSDLQVYFDYNTLAFGENIFANGNITYERLALLLGEIAPGFPMYNIYGPQDNKPYRYVILSEAATVIANPMFMNEVPLLPVYQGYAKFKIIVQDQNQLAGVAFVPEDGGVGLMNGGQYYVSAIQPLQTKYGDPPDYAGVYENNLLTFPLHCMQPLNEWTGAVNEDWFDNGNWSLGWSPLPTEDVLIPDVGKAPFPIILGGSSTIANLTVSVGAWLTIAATGDLTATGLTTIDGMLHITSDMTGASGSFIDAGGLAGAGNFQFDRYLTSAPPGIDDGWHYISSPVNNTVTGDFIGYWVKEWQESTNTFFDIDPFIGPNCCPPSQFTVSINVMQGYSVKQDITYSCVCPTGNVIEFGGDLQGNCPDGTVFSPPCPGNHGTALASITNVNTGNLTSTITGSNSGANAYPNWNLVGNPYPSGWDYDAFFLGPNWPAGLFDAIYYWDEAFFQYASYVNGISNNNGSQFVPPTQAFFFEADGTVPVIPLNFTNAERTYTGAGYFYKEIPQELLRLEVAGSENVDQTTIYFAENATAMHDGNFDAKKLFSETVSLWTNAGSIDLSINGMPATDMVPVNFKAVASGTYTIEAIDNGFEFVYLEDLKTGILHDLNSAYEFSYTEGEDTDRFVIHFGEISLENAQYGIVVYSYENNVYVYNANNLTGNINILSVMGQQVTNVSLENGLNTISMNDVNAYFVVNVVTNSTVISEKVYIR